MKNSHFIISCLSSKYILLLALLVFAVLGRFFYYIEFSVRAFNSVLSICGLNKSGETTQSLTFIMPAMSVRLDNWDLHLSTEPNVIASAQGEGIEEWQSNFNGLGSCLYSKVL